MSHPTKRAEIHLGDLARALGSLRWQTDAEARAIAACLGFGLAAPAPRPKPPTEIYDRQRYLASTAGQVQRSPPPPIFAPPAPEPAPELPGNTLASRLKPLDERAPPLPGDADWLQEEDALYSDNEALAVVRHSLFPERTNRHLISAALATQRPGQDIDLDRLVAAICRREVVCDLPRCAESTLELGCQLLLDYSATMVPFWEDLNDLIGQVQDVVGCEGTRVFSFDGRPTGAVRWTPAGAREVWQPDGRPVVAATDFGIQGCAGRVDPDPDWRALAERCAREGVPLVVLCPWPEERWPLGIAGCPELVHWSPYTSAAMIRRKIGLGHRLG